MQWDQPQGSQKGAAPSQQAMRKAFEVVFVDSSGWCNLAAHVSKSALKQVGAPLLYLGFFGERARHYINAKPQGH